MKISHCTLFVCIAAAVAPAQRTASRPSAANPPAAEDGLTPRQMVAAYEKGSAKERERLFPALIGVARQVEAELGALLGHKEASVRLAGLRIFQQAVIKAPAAPLTALTRDADDAVREAAVIYLAACRPDGWTGTLVRVAGGDKSQSIRRQAIVGLSESKDLAVVPELISMLGFVSDDYIAKKLNGALCSLTGETKAIDPVAWERWWVETGTERLRAQEAARAEKVFNEGRSTPPK